MKPNAARNVYDGKLIDVTLERWGEHEREIVEHPGAVAIVPVDRDGMLTLVRQRREAARKELLELPAGTLEQGETPLESAQRELEEETGLVAERLHPLPAIFTTPGFTDERIHLFLAEELTPGPTSLDHDEFIEAVPMPLSEALRMVREEEITDAKTVCTLLYAAGFVLGM